MPSQLQPCFRQWWPLMHLCLVWVVAVADAACTSSPSSDLGTCSQQCCGTSACTCTNRPTPVTCEYQACVLVALQRHGCEDDAAYADAYAEAAGNATACNQTLSASGCPSMTLWGDASRCTSALTCSGGLATQCTASCYAETLLCYAGSRCGVGLSMSAVNYCQWLLGVVSGAAADGPLGVCYPELNQSVVAHYDVCVAAISQVSSLRVADNDEEVRRLQTTVLALCLVLGMAIAFAGAMALRWCLPRIIKRRRQVGDAKSMEQGRPESAPIESRSSRTADGRGSTTVKSSLILPLFTPATNNPAATSGSSHHRSSGGTAPPRQDTTHNGNDNKLRKASEHEATHEKKDVDATTNARRSEDDAHELSRRSSAVGWVGAVSGEPASPRGGSPQRPAVRQRSLTRQASDELVALTAKLILAGMWDQVRLLGRGASGTVYCCLLGSGALVARKDVDIQDVRATELRLLSEELKVVSRLKHSNCVRYMTAEVHREQRKAVMWMEYLPGGSLASIVSHVGRPLPEHVAKSYLRQILQGLAYLHANGIIHRDVKADNVLVDSDGIVKLADFGCSKLLRRRKDALHLSSGSSVSSAGASVNAMATSMVGTPCFMAPEIIGTVDAESVAASVTRSTVEVGYGVEADVWSFGIMACEVLSQGAMPWPQMNSYWELMVHISQKEPDIPHHLSAACRAFVLECLVRNPKQRASARALLRHPWLEAPTDEDGGGARSDHDQFGFLNCVRALEAMDEEKQQLIVPAPSVGAATTQGDGSSTQTAAVAAAVVVVPDATQDKSPGDAAQLQPAPSMQAVPSLHIVLDVVPDDREEEENRVESAPLHLPSKNAEGDRPSVMGMSRPSTMTSSSQQQQQRVAGSSSVQKLSVGSTALSRSS